MTGETVTVLRPDVGTDRYGDPVKDWSDPTRIDLDGCALAPAGVGTGGSGTREDTAAGREGVVDGWDLFCPPGADITALDRVEARGQVYEVDGQPATWTSPYGGATGGVQVSLRRVEG